MQRIASELRPGILDDLGLAAAIEWQTGEFRKRTGLAGRCAVPGEEPELAPGAATALFRILQEALTNVARHARARAVDVELAVEGTQASLRVTDDGVGINDEQLQDRSSMGVVGMRERAAALGGRVSVAGEPGRGTTVWAKLPRHPRENAP
ncbi:MAG: sensor histidine kinase [Deferrisomatales bacterium]